MKNLFLFLMLAAPLFLITSCDKEDDHKDADIDIAITSPTGGGRYPNSGTLSILGNILSNVEIEDIHIKILNPANDELIQEVKEVEHLHAESFVVDEKFTWDPALVTVATDFELKIEVSADDDDDKHDSDDDDDEEIEISFTIDPAL